MLQYPTNVYPQSIAVTDIEGSSNHWMNFIFNGDILTSVWHKFYDYNSGEIALTFNFNIGFRHPIAYNGEKYSTGIYGGQGDLQRGKDYMYQMMLTQSSVDGSENIYDMPIVRGTVLSASGTTVLISKGINNIYEWNVLSNDVCVPSISHEWVYAGAIIKVGNESHFIQSYNRRTGELIIDSAFSFDISGNNYTILCNYLITPMYYFMYRSSPTLTLTSDIIPSWTISYISTSPAIRVEGVYTPPEDGDMIKYYTIKLWHRLQDDTDIHLIEETPKIYSQNIDYKFFNDFVDHVLEEGAEPQIDMVYGITCTGVTQNGLTFSENADEFTITGNTEDVLIDDIFAECIDEHSPDYIGDERHINQSVVITYGSIHTSDTSVVIDIYRKDLETGTTTHLYHIMKFGENTCVDWTVPNKGKFEYVILPRDKDTGVPYLASRKAVQVETNFIGYSIIALEESDIINDVLFNAKKQYTKGQSWIFHGEIQDSSITQNFNRTVQAGAGRYPTMSSGDNNYLSGTLTADIGYVSCAEKEYKDTIDMVNAWRKFISQDKIYMLKTQKGDVLMVNIVGTPTVTYQENMPNVPATISFDWVECDSIDNYIFTEIS